MLTLVALLTLSHVPRSLVFTTCAAREFTVPGLQRIAIGDSSTVDVKAIGNDRVRLIPAVASGMTTLLMWTSSGERVSIKVVVRTGHACSR